MEKKPVPFRNGAVDGKTSFAHAVLMLFYGQPTTKQCFELANILCRPSVPPKFRSTPVLFLRKLRFDYHRPSITPDPLPSTTIGPQHEIGRRHFGTRAAYNPSSKACVSAPLGPRGPETLPCENENTRSGHKTQGFLLTPNSA